MSADPLVEWMRGEYRRERAWAIAGAVTGGIAFGLLVWAVLLWVS